MASQFVRSVRDVKDLNTLSDHASTINDLISDIDSNVYVKTKDGYKRITGGDAQGDIDLLEKDLETLKNITSSNTKNIDTLTTDIGTYETDITTLKRNTSDNAIDIETLKINTSDNTSDIDTLKSTTSDNTIDISTLKNDTSDNLTEIELLRQQIETLQASIRKHYVLYTGSVNGVGSTLTLSDDINTFDVIYISGTYPGGTFNQTVLTSTIDTDINIQKDNLRDSDGVYLGVYEIKLTVNNSTELEITNDVSWAEQTSSGSGAGRNAYTITRVEGVK